MAVLMRLCDEDLESFPGPEWVRFDEADLDDLSFKTLHEFEVKLDTTIEFLLLVDKTARTTKWTAARAWMARKLAGVDTPDFDDFDIKPRKVQIKDEPAAEQPGQDGDEGGDADPPSSAPSSAAKASKKASR